jgi:hypothetical protein
MDIIKISQVLSTSHLRSYRDDDFFIDRISHRYSVVAFTIFAMLVTTKAYIGDPIGKGTKIKKNNFVSMFI